MKSRKLGTVTHPKYKELYGHFYGITFEKGIDTIAEDTPFGVELFCADSEGNGDCWNTEEEVIAEIKEDLKSWVKRTPNELELKNSGDGYYMG